MNNFFRDNIFKIILYVPSIFILVGTVIINLSISKYGIEDFYVISSKNLVAGMTFFFMHMLFVVVYFAAIDTKNILNNSWQKLLIGAVIKPVLFVGMFGLFLIPVMKFHIPILVFLASLLSL